MNGLGGKIAENIIFVFEFALIVVLLVLIAYAVEKYLHLKQHSTERILSTRKISMIGLFSAVSAVLMVFDLPVPFAPPFYKIDLSELPVLVIAFAYGPVAGVMTEFVKILLKLAIQGTDTAFVGEFSNLTGSIVFICSAALIYKKIHTKKGALISMIVSSLLVSVLFIFINAYVMFPLYVRLYGMPMEAIIGMGSAVNPLVKDEVTLMLFGVFPFNLVKHGVTSLITYLVYKKCANALRSILRVSQEAPTAA